ncbi:MAG: 2-amino-4-hydroxy-6-hydroxymethyldihydropteridine diphosphokinase [Candidatus Omnitrophica bacterium]|nr:2-amino-4-hydroxy-6-hydroxymethyldihydropteridine diphosphokinase [Candidatus Omnitrophota bacterium]
MGDRKKNMALALEKLSRIKGIKIEKVSSLYETAPVGVVNQARFLNAAAKIRTGISPGRLLNILKKIEKDMGRKRSVRFGPRIIDLDILFYDNVAIKARKLIIPHPRMFERKFVILPLRELI